MSGFRHIARTAIREGTISEVEFTVSGEMVAEFAELTGDFSSLHMDGQFARKSIFRSNVVHGMLPVCFLPRLDFLIVEGLSCIPVEIGGQFLEPIHEGSNLCLRGTIDTVDVANGSVVVDFSIEDTSRHILSTRGKAAFRYIEKRPAGEDPREPLPAGEDRCLIIDPPGESDLVIDRIAKDDRDGFRFRVVDRAISSILRILGENPVAADGPRGNPCGIADGFHIPHLLATALLSTSVGMCLPGKFATFLDFQLSFHGILEKGIEYDLAGVVTHVSRSTSIVKKSVSITGIDAKDALVSGKVNVLVNAPPARMPSLQLLRDSATDPGLKEKVVLVTGASRGIGETIAKMFAAFGSSVAVNYFRGKEDAERVAEEISSQGGRAFAVHADVADPLQVRRMVERIMDRWGAIHVLVNNAVRDFRPMKFVGLSWDEVQKDIDVVARGAFHCCQEVIPVMLRQGGGKIINLSTVATEVPPPRQVKYVVAKSALVGLTRSLAAEFASKNIQVNMIVPGFVETDLVSHVPQVYRKKIAEETPMGRHATPVDVAHAAIFLASAFSSFTTGQKLLVTGGGAPYL